MSNSKCKVGDRISYRYWFMSAEQGQRNETEWEGRKVGTVVAVDDFALDARQILVELPDGSRERIAREDVIVS